MSHFKLELGRKKVGDKLTLGSTHITSMTNNTAYPVEKRAPTDAQVQTAQDNLDTAHAAVEAAEVVWKQKIQARDVREAEWDTIITARAANCESITPNDLAALASTGFPLRGASAPVGDLPAPGNLTATAGDDEGEVDLGCDAVRGASSYEWECKPHNDAGVWAPVKTTTKSKITVTALTPGTLYAFRARAVGAAGPGAWSDEAVKRAP